MKVVSKLFSDSLWAFVFQIAPRFASALLFILMSRLAGPTQAGSFSLAATYLVIVTTLMRGLDELIIRQVAQSPAQSAQTLASFLTLRLGLGIVFCGGTLALVWGWLKYPPATSLVITILALSAIPDSLAYVAQAVLLGRRQFSAPGMVMMSVNALKVIAGAWTLTHHGTVIAVAWLWLGGSVLGMVLMTAIAFGQVGGAQWRDWRFPLARVRTVAAFIGIAVLLTLDTQIDNVILSVFHPESEVAWYFAATTLLSGFLMLSQAYRFSIYPLMARYAAHAPEKLVSLYDYSIRYIGIGIFPLSTILILSAPVIVGWVYGASFQPVVQIWRILSAALVGLYLNEPNSRMLLVHNQQGQILFFLSVSTVVNLTLNGLLTPQWGASGTAYARLGSSGLLFLLCTFYVNRYLTKRSVLDIIVKLAVIALTVFGVYSFSKSAFPIYVSIAFVIFAYVFLVILLGIIRKSDFIMISTIFRGGRDH